MPFYWVMRDQVVNYKGWFIESIFKAMHSILADHGYSANEHDGWMVPIRNEQGAIIGRMTGVKWRSVRELEYKYTEAVFEVKLSANIYPKPRPGTDPKAGIMADSGTLQVRFHGLIRTDNRFIWAKSPMLKYLLPIREKYFYYPKIEKFKQMMRRDYEEIMEDLKKYLSYLPAVA